MLRIYFLCVFQFICIVTAAELREINDTTDGMRLVSQSGAFFSADIYGELKSNEQRKGQNFVFSPYSLSILLAMLKSGCKGLTAKEINDALRLTGLNNAVTLQGYQRIITSLQSSPNVTVTIANKLYVDDTFRLKPSFKEELKRFFHSEAETVDFAQTGTAASVVNKWVSGQTKGKIPEIIKPRDLNKDTKSMLVNAIYFSGQWEQSFDRELTQLKPFTTVKNQQVMEKFMRTEGPMFWSRLKDLEADAVAIPYTGGRLSLVALLPLNASGFSSLEEKLRGYDLSSIPEKLRETPVILELPKIRLETTLDLVDEGILEKIGIKTAFGKGETKPDLSGMTENTDGLYVNSVVQKAFLEISEEGTTAAAAGQSATVVKILPQRFIANRPFVAFIFDSETKSILFLFRKTS